MVPFLFSRSIKCHERNLKACSEVRFIIRWSYYWLSNRDSEVWFLFIYNSVNMFFTGNDILPQVYWDIPWCTIDSWGLSSTRLSSRECMGSKWMLITNNPCLDLWALPAGWPFGKFCQHGLEICHTSICRSFQSYDPMPKLKWLFHSLQF